jgi:hypothetical protein
MDCGKESLAPEAPAGFLEGTSPGFTRFTVSGEGNRSQSSIRKSWNSEKTVILRGTDTGFPGEILKP